VIDGATDLAQIAGPAISILAARRRARMSAFRSMTGSYGRTRTVDDKAEDGPQADTRRQCAGIQPSAIATVVPPVSNPSREIFLHDRIGHTDHDSNEQRIRSRRVQSMHVADMTFHSSLTGMRPAVGRIKRTRRGETKRRRKYRQTLLQAAAKERTRRSISTL
jgi:hypothetical protein